MHTAGVSQWVASRTLGLSRACVFRVTYPLMCVPLFNASLMVDEKGRNM